MSDDVFYRISMNMNVDPAEIAKIVHDYIERGIGCDYDRLNCPKPPIYIGPVKVETLKERLDNYKKHKHIKEDNKMKATSVQNIKNVKDVCFSIDNHPAEMESKLTIVASTNDDIFAFEFEGSDLLQNCKRAGLFTGWEKDQKIRELEKKNDELTKAYDILDKTLEKSHKKCNEWYEKWAEMLRKYHLERAANEAHHRFFKQYAGKGTEIEFNCSIGDTDETSYVIVDKDRYQTLKDNNNRCVMINGRSYTYSEMVNRIVELEELKTPTIENFEEPSNRADILEQAKKCVCGHREQDYGTPESNFKLIADLWNDYLGLAENGDGVPIFSIKNITPTDVAMMMALMKIARIRNGGGSGDSFVDLAGYAACGGEIWHSNKETNTDSN